MAIVYIVQLATFRKPIAHVHMVSQFAYTALTSIICTYSSAQRRCRSSLAYNTCVVAFTTHSYVRYKDSYAYVRESPEHVDAYDVTLHTTPSMYNMKATQALSHVYSAVKATSDVICYRV